MITITDAAARKVINQLAKRGKGLGLKIGVKTTGCSGLAYVLEYVDIIDDTLNLYENNGVKVWIDPKHEPYIRGLIMDWARNGLNEGFDFKNPNERDRCGCGESFRI